MKAFTLTELLTVLATLAVLFSFALYNSSDEEKMAKKIDNGVFINSKIMEATNEFHENWNIEKTIEYDHGYKIIYENKDCGGAPGFSMSFKQDCRNDDIQEQEDCEAKNCIYKEYDTCLYSPPRTVNKCQ